MRKFKNLITMGIIASFAFTANAASEDKKVEVKESGSINSQLSDVRTDISMQILKNKLADAELEHYRKQQEIQAIKNQLEYGTEEPTNAKKETVDVDVSRKFNESLDEEDILVENNNWAQEVGFIYQSDTTIGHQPSSSSSLGSLSDDISGDDSLTEMLKTIQDNIEEDPVEDEVVTNSINDTNAFKLINVELSKLIIFGEHKSAKIKANYLTDNGYQKIKGSKIVTVSEGDDFQVKGQVAFKVLKIDETGVHLENTTTGREEFVNP